jgi:uncharacterized phage infection (PIP) family protein YhgE
MANASGVRGAGGLQDDLAALTSLLPRVPEALHALLEAQSALSEAAEQFLQTLDARQAEAAELFPRLEVSLSGVAREAAEGTAQVDRDGQVSETLADPGLSFEEHTVLFPHSFIEKQHHVVQQKTAALEAAQQRAQGLDFTRQALHDGLVAGKQTVSTSVEASLGAGAGLQGMVETARATVGSDVQNLGVEIDQTHTAHGREVEGLRRDVDGHQANFSDRLDQLRNALRTDTDRMLENARDRIEDLSSTLSRAMSDLKDGLHELDDQLKEASEEAAEGRQSLAPPFEEMENLLRPLKQAIENVREAAANVGIAF